jgi:hypothetical protein
MVRVKYLDRVPSLAEPFPMPRQFCVPARMWVNLP